MKGGGEINHTKKPGYVTLYYDNSNISRDLNILKKDKIEIFQNKVDEGGLIKESPEPDGTDDELTD